MGGVGSAEMTSIFASAMGVSTGAAITVWNLGSLRGITWAGAIACVDADGGVNMDDTVGVGDDNVGGGKGDQGNGCRLIPRLTSGEPD